MDVKLLGIYLKDHLAGSRSGIELARRAERENQGNPVGEYLATFLMELEQDRSVLEQVARGLGVSRDILKESAAWVMERASRLKLNGRLVSYSPLSRMMELEGLCIASQGRLCLWRELERLSRTERRLAGFDFAALIARTEAHIKALDRLRLHAADAAFSSAPVPDDTSHATVH
ncbi:hypothetical protein [Hyalangium rubrum]|uniref:Uncharacterized protein n=1 Tax=Hyalangium rubrum TaxID=3103134 RepID=A0ABU5GV97_9BACT|nr:hypothetical protein [Hyalangium sp. s54d21]MDY7225095.1 hypothetical protein [Hyalangium sp. s54d21]